MRRGRFLLNIILLLAIVAAVLLWQPARNGQAVPQVDLVQGGGVLLAGPHGPMRLEDFRGKVVLLYLGYTYCPDICPTSLVTWGQALKTFSPRELERIRPIFVSVDPERDSAARLAEYTAFFHPAIIGVSGTPDQLKALAQGYGAAFVRQENASAGGYVIDHTAQTYLIAADGRLVERLPHGILPDELAAALRKHLPPF